MRIGMSVFAVLLFACGGPDSPPSETGGSSNATGGSTQQALAGSGGSSGSIAAGQGGSAASSSTTECQLEERADGPRMSLTGTVCGQAVSFTTTAGQRIQLSRSSLLWPIEEITTVTVKDDPSDFSPHVPDYFDDFSLLFNVALEQGGPTLAEQSGDFTLEEGMLAACGFGSLVLGPGPARVAIESIEGEPEGRMRMSVSNISVLGFDPAYGKMTVPACAGTVSVTLEGNYSHDPG